MMVKAEKAPEENPYILSEEERTCPEGLSMEEKMVWLNERIEIQREGIKRRVKPQLLRGVPRNLRSKWRGEVWNEWLKTLPEEEREAIRRQTGPAKPRHYRLWARGRRDK